MSQTIMDSINKLKHVMRVGGLGIWEFDCRTGLSYWNEEVFHIFGQTPHGGPIPYETLMDVIHPDDREAVHRAVLASAQERIDIHYRIMLPNQECRHVHAQAAEVPGGDVNHLYGIIQDVTAQRVMERQLRERTQRYESLKKYNPDGICSLDFEGRILGANPAFGRLTGYSLAELLEMNYTDLLEEEDAGRFAGKLLKVKDRRRKLRSTLCHKRGHRIETESTSVPIVIDEETRGAYLIVKDVSAFNEQQRRLKDIEIRHKLISENSQDIISYSNVQGKCEYVSPAIRLLGYEPEEWMGFTTVGFYHPEDIPHMIDLANRMAAGEDVARFDCRVRCKDGTYTWIESTVKAVRDERGKMIGVLGIGRDSSLRRRMEEALIRSEKLSAVGQLAAGIAHEIRNPLTALKGFSQLLRARSRGDKRRYFDIMQSELNRIDMILGELLVLAKPQAISYKPKEVDLVLQEVIALLGTEAILNNVVIATDFNIDAPMVECEENQLKQVFVNMIKNAIEAMPNGGQLFVRIYAQESNVTIEFEDEGEGISVEQMERMGEPFYTTKSKGTGLGVMVSYKIIEAHRGRIEYSRGVEKGTIVRIHLPVYHTKVHG